MLKRLSRAVSRRLKVLAEKMQDEGYRHGYVEGHNRQILAKQMREFRGGTPQTEFAEHIGKRQTMISRLENPNYFGWTLNTIFDIAAKLDVAVIVRFVDFPTFLKFSEDMSDKALHPRRYDQEDVDALLEEKESASIILQRRKDDDPIRSYRLSDDDSKPIEEIQTPMSGDSQVIEAQRLQ